MPRCAILDNVQLEANSYVIQIKEVDSGTGKVWPSQYNGDGPDRAQVKLPGLHTPNRRSACRHLGRLAQERRSHHEGLHGGGAATCCRRI